MSDAKGMSFKGGKAGSETVHYSRRFTLNALKNHFNWGTPFPAFAEHWSCSQATRSPLSWVRHQALGSLNIPFSKQRCQ